MLIFFIFSIVSTLDISFKLPSRQLRCFGDKLQAGQAIQGLVSGDSSEFSLKISDSDTNKQIQYTYNEIEQKFKHQFNTSVSIQICIHNLAHYPLEAHFIYEQGVTVELASQEDVKEIEKYVRQLNKSLIALKNEHEEISTQQTNRNEKMNILSSKIILMSLLTIVLMIIVTIFFAFKAQSVMKLKKTN